MRWLQPRWETPLNRIRFLWKMFLTRKNRVRKPEIRFCSCSGCAYLVDREERTRETMCGGISNCAGQRSIFIENTPEARQQYNAAVTLQRLKGKYHAPIR